VLDNNQQAVFEIGEKYVVAFCTKVQEEGIAPVKDVENEIRFVLIKDKKAEILSAEYKKNMQEGKSLDELASDMKLTVREATQVNFRSYSIPDAGSEPALIAAASAAKQGVLSGPVKGENGIYMLTVNEISNSDSDDIRSLKDRLSITYQMRGSYEAYEALRKATNIVDKRYKFY